MKNRIQHSYNRYAANVQALLSELGKYTPENLNRKPAPGAWSAIQTLHHLILVEENSLKYVRKKLGYDPELESAGPGAWFRSRLMLLSLSSPIKFRAPKAAGNEQIPDAADFEETCIRWRKIQEEWRTFFENMPPEMQNKAVYKHPFAGRISWLQMLEFFNVHFVRHRRQVRKAVSQDDTGMVG